MRRAAGVVAVAIGCGRLGFDPSRTTIDAPADVPADAPTPIALIQVQAPGFGSAAMVSTSFVGLAGDLLVAAIYWDETPDTVTLTDTAGLAWSSLPSQVMPGCGGPTGNATGAQLAYAPVATTGPITVTVAQTSGTQPLGLFVLEYSGIAVLDTSSVQLAPAASNAMTAAPVTTSSTDVVLAFFTDTINTGACSSGPGFTVEGRDTGFPNIIEDVIAPAGTYTATATLPSGQSDACWIGFTVAFRPR